jgi:hypothetical protein
MSDDESEFNSPEDEGPEDEGPEDEEDVEERAWQELEESTREPDSVISIPFGDLEISEEESKNIDEKFESFDELSNQLADGDFSNDSKAKEELLIKLREKYFTSIQKPVEDAEPKPDLNYNAYNFARTAGITSLEFSWTKLDSKIKSLIEELRDTNLTDEKINDLETVIEKFRRKCIRKTIDFEKPKDKTANDIDEPEIFEDIMKSLPDIYSAVFDVFLEPVTTWISEENSHLSAPEILKFRAYNLDLRNKKRLAILKKKDHTPNYTKCNYDYYVITLKKMPFVKGLLFQGYWQVEPMMTELRNHVEHWKKRGNKTYLKKELGRDMIDPISETESSGNLIILTSVLLLVSYHFIDVLQAWVDTDNYLKQ